MPMIRDNRMARLVSVSKAADMLGVTRPTVRNWCEEGRLAWEAVDDGRHGIYAVVKKSVEQYARARARREV